MTRNSVAGVACLIVLGVFSWAQTPVTTGTYAVGTCKPSLPSFTSISAALAATPAPSTVLVCPGTYVEQIMITQPVTLQGVTSGGSGQVIVQLPGIGYVTSVENDHGASVGAQLFVINASGPVTVSDITFDASSGGSFFGIASGIFFQNSSGTVNRVTTIHDTTQFAQNIGVYIEGGTSNPSVTVQNSSMHDAMSSGIRVETANGTINATIKSNYVSANAVGVFLDQGSTGTVANNVIQGGGEGISTDPSSAGSVSGNTIVGSNVGIDLESEAVSVTNNKIYNSNITGINAVTTSATVQGNTINGGPTGIDFGCFADPNAKSNTINEVGVGLNNVPSGASPANNYFNVGTIRSQGTCPGAK